ncbi:hypothetical protein D3C80_1783710 [compost metagenome]
MLDKKATGKAAEYGTDAIGHHHKQTLCRRADLLICICFYKQRTGNIEEVECHAVNNTGQDNHP